MIILCQYINDLMEFIIWISVHAKVTSKTEILSGNAPHSCLSGSILKIFPMQVWAGNIVYLYPFQERAVHVEML